MQHDFWHYVARAGREKTVSFPCYLDTRQPRDRWARIATRPILTSGDDQAFPQRPTLEVDADGEPQRWTTDLEHGQKIAFLTRLVDPINPEPPFAEIDSPLLRLVRDAYKAPGVHVVGQGHPRTDRKHAFAEVFLERSR